LMLAEQASQEQMVTRSCRRRLPNQVGQAANRALYYRGFKARLLRAFKSFKEHQLRGPLTRQKWYKVEKKVKNPTPTPLEKYIWVKYEGVDMDAIRNIFRCWGHECTHKDGDEECKKLPEIHKMGVQQYLTDEELPYVDQSVWYNYYRCVETESQAKKVRYRYRVSDMDRGAIMNYLKTQFAQEKAVADTTYGMGAPMIDAILKLKVDDAKLREWTSLTQEYKKKYAEVEEHLRIARKPEILDLILCADRKSLAHDCGRMDIFKTHGTIANLAVDMVDLAEDADAILEKRVEEELKRNREFKDKEHEKLQKILDEEAAKAKEEVKQNCRFPSRRFPSRGRE